MDQVSGVLGAQEVSSCLKGESPGSFNGISREFMGISKNLLGFQRRCRDIRESQGCSRELQEYFIGFRGFQRPSVPIDYLRVSHTMNKCS